MADEPELPHVNLPQKPEPIVNTDIPDDGGLDNSLQPTDQPPADGAPAAETPPEAVVKPEPLKKSPFQSRVDSLTAQREQERRGRVAAEEQLALANAMLRNGKPDGEIQPATGLTQTQIDELVNRKAAELAASAASKKQTDRLVSAGNAEFHDFTDRCNIVASLGAGDRSDFMQVVTDPDTIPDGHKVIAQLAENPEEAARILALPTAQMSAALVRFQMEHSKPASGKQISGAPAPIRPLDGINRGTGAMTDNEPMGSYAAKFYADKAKKKARP